jgi:hypothetical protein
MTAVTDTVGSILIAIGSGLVIVAVIFDLFIRLRMFLTIGDRQAFLRRGLDWSIYDKYRASGKLKGWAAWPVDVMWAFLVIGAVVFIIGVVTVNSGGR